MKYFCKITFAFLLLLVFSQLAFSCECEAPNQRKAFRKAKAIFIGQVIEIKESKNQSAANSIGLTRVDDIKFKVEKTWKGVKASEITVVSDNGYLVCKGFPYRIGEKYLVYANGQDLIAISHCMRNLPITAAFKDVQNLNNFLFRFAARLFPF